jgi:hypothetical protein
MLTNVIEIERKTDDVYGSFIRVLSRNLDGRLTAKKSVLNDIDSRPTQTRTVARSLNEGLLVA